MTGLQPLMPNPRFANGGIIVSPRGAREDSVPINCGCVVVPVGMSDLLDDWFWSPDAAHWDPDVASGKDPGRSTASVPAWSIPCYVDATLRIRAEAFEAVMTAMRAVASSASEYRP